MNNACKSGGYSCGRIIGGIFIAIAIALTVMTHSEAGILGLFIAGTFFCVSNRSGAGCKPCGGCGSCSCCCPCDGPASSCGPVDMSCEIPKPKKAAAPRKKVKKIV